ncbi:hypothetical protein THRCLA_08395 [Thraustotheca clavata]|uniref:DUF5880 domain-containing protein n=1 Tax=Thraustotheca clavata TaxID=74557 RepID=A0A1V9Z6S7_9STRA|nr:hypothetical protein THRCLA_08395 [Thraustotheca clavata]
MVNDKKRAASGDDSTAKKAKLLGGLDVAAVMSAEGPIVKCVLLKQDGTSKEIDIDFTPSKQVVQNLLGGDHTFVGQYEDIEVMIMCNPEHQEVESGVELTKHKLQPPFHGRLGQIRGDILLFRCDASGDHKDFTVDEWEAFLKQDIPEWEPPSDEEESSEDDEDEEGYRKAAIDFFIQEFKDNNDGSEPNEDELKEIEERVAKEMEGPDPAQAALDYLLEEFEEEYGREPNEEELAEIEKQVAEKLAQLEDEDDEEGNAMETLIQQLYEAAIERFTKEHGEEPDDDAKEQIARAVADAAAEQFGVQLDVIDEEEESNEESSNEEDENTEEDDN